MQVSQGEPNILQRLVRLIQWYQSAMQHLERHPTTDQYRLLLCAREIGLDSHTVRSEVTKIAAAHDPPENHREHIVESILRQVVLMRFEVANDDRLRFFDYWIAKKNINGETTVTVAYIMGLGVEQLDLLPDNISRQVRPWFLRNRTIAPDRLKAWLPRHFHRLGHESEATKAMVEVLESRDGNGSWAGSHERTAAALFALSRCSLVKNYDLCLSLSYLLRRLDRGLSGNTALEATTLKVAHAFGILPVELHGSLVEAAMSEAVFTRHLPEESIARIYAAAISCRLDRSILLGGLDARFVAQLPTRFALGEQILSDLHVMNEIVSLVDGTVPIRTWLKNALTVSASRHESEIFREYLRQLSR